MLSSRSLRVAALILVAIPALCKSEKEQAATTIINRAKQLSDIRADGSPSFRLRASFKALNKDAAPTEGTYTEVWVSPDRWRIEVAAGDAKTVIVANGAKQWTAVSDTVIPAGVEEIGLRMNGPMYTPETFKIDRVEVRDIGSQHVRCIESPPDLDGARATVCFDLVEGLPALRGGPAGAGGVRSVKRDCTFSDYQKFGEKMFPHVVKCSEGQVPVFESTVLELSPERAPDPALFVPMAGSREWVNCHHITRGPGALYAPDPRIVKRGDATVAISFLIGADGKPRELKVVRSADAVTDKAALDAVRLWIFRPALCEGQPMEVAIVVTVHFHVP